MDWRGVIALLGMSEDEVDKFALFYKVDEDVESDTYVKPFNGPGKQALLLIQSFWTRISIERFRHQCRN
ncbi:hypothetical protein RMATCC62417_10814 [Rhizopus microsporus]|nr:hypothetical protein RMATCC62417_10814 [Rhizopus microsporus]